MKPKQTRIAGMTLIEVMIVVVIVGILAGIAYPSYLTSIRKSRRAEAVAALNAVQLAQEKLRASCPFYGQVLGGAANVCGADAANSTIQAPTQSENGRYTITLAGASSIAYTATATAVGDQANDQDGGTTCTLVLTVNAANPDGLRTPAQCWN
ncbi:MAG: type IV pilin protein [Gammaproteobacteria bacterium]|jgi:type IV pilus assembly protein PilE